MDVGGDMLVLILVNLGEQGDGGGLEEHGSHGGLRDIEHRCRLHYIKHGVRDTVDDDDTTKLYPAMRITFVGHRDQKQLPILLKGRHLLYTGERRRHGGLGDGSVLWFVRETNNI